MTADPAAACRSSAPQQRATAVDRPGDAPQGAAPTAFRSIWPITISYAPDGVSPDLASKALELWMTEEGSYPPDHGTDPSSPSLLESATERMARAPPVALIDDLVREGAADAGRGVAGRGRRLHRPSYRREHERRLDAAGNDRRTDPDTGQRRRFC
jgi:hypothetical protein